MPVELQNLLAVVCVVVFVYMTMWYVVAIIIKRNDIADIAWGLGFITIATTSLFASQNNSFTAYVTLLLVAVWGLRLSWHIARRSFAKSEDYRYKKWRDDWGEWFYVRSFLQVFMLQGLLMIIVSLPILVIMAYSTSQTSILVAVGVLIWIFGFIFETVGDWQLRNFIRNPKHKGKIMTTGLWSNTRHPNYFGEIVQWWGIGVIALSCSYGWVGLLGPLAITFLIVKVSGIPMLEQKYDNNPEYQSYKKHTPKLIPRFNIHKAPR